MIFDQVLVSQISTTTALFVLLVSIMVGFGTSYVYQKTFKGASYSASFVSSLIYLTVITAVVMMVVGSNLARAFGLVGALSIIRFRTAIKDPKDISFIFLSLVMGLTVGTENYHIAAISSVVILALVYILDRVNYGVYLNNQYFLVIDVDAKRFSEDNLSPLFDVYAKEASLYRVSTLYKKPNIVRRIYKIRIISDSPVKLISEISALDSVREVSTHSAESYVLQ